MPTRPPIHGQRPKAVRTHDPDAYRASAAARGYDGKHRKRRLLVLAHDPLCVQCLAEGRTTPATVYDHVQAMSAGGSRVDMCNAQGLCEECHNRKTAKEMRR